MKVKWKYIFLYALIALGLSYPIQSGVLDDYFNSITEDTFLFGSTYLLAGLSTLFAGAVVLLFHKGSSKRITILGDDRIKNLLILVLPILSFSVIGIKNNSEMSESLHGFAFASINTVYAFAEEFGWRRYLQNALEGLNKHLKYILISVIWWIWHFRFDTQFDLFIFPVICIGGGFLLGKLADDTKSILPVVAMHTLIILTTSMGSFGKNEILGIGLVMLGWITIEMIWKRKVQRS